MIRSLTFSILLLVASNAYATTHWTCMEAWEDAADNGGSFETTAGQHAAVARNSIIGTEPFQNAWQQYIVATVNQYKWERTASAISIVTSDFDWNEDDDLQATANSEKELRDNAAAAGTTYQLRLLDKNGASVQINMPSKDIYNFSAAQLLLLKAR